jgi:hypothetical protein
MSLHERKQPFEIGGTERSRMQRIQLCDLETTDMFRPFR